MNEGSRERDMRLFYGGYMKGWRETQGLTQQQVAQRLCRSVSRVSECENGKGPNTSQQWRQHFSELGLPLPRMPRRPY